MTEHYYVPRLERNHHSSGSASALIDEELEVSKEDELFLRNHWKLIAIAQFFNLFKPVLRFRDCITPYDLEQSLLRPQHDPLCGDLVTRLLTRKGAKAADSGAPLYDQWSMQLAKRFSAMHKEYAKFAARFL